MFLFKQKNTFSLALKILLVTNAMILLSGAMFGPIYALFVGKIGGNLLDASFTGAIFALAAGITTLFSGRISDKVKETELIIVAGYSLIGFGFLLYTVCNSIWFLFGIQIIIGLGEAIYSPAFDTVYSKHLNRFHTGKQWGAWESINYFSLAFGATIGGVIASFFGFTVLFTTMAILSFASAFYIYKLPRKIL